MSEARPVSEMFDAMDPAELAEIDAEFPAFMEELELAELRHALQLSQATLAKVLNINQSSVAKLEKRSDMFVSTLRNFVEAMGGELEIVARFPGRDFRIKSFSDLHEEIENDCHA